MTKPVQDPNLAQDRKLAELELRVSQLEKLVQQLEWRVKTIGG